MSSRHTIKIVSKEWYAEQWLFRDEHLKETPSIMLGMSPLAELECRHQAAKRIREISDRLRESFVLAHPHAKKADIQPTTPITNTALVFMQRFYVYHPFQKFPPNAIASAALFLAAKVDDEPLKLEYIMKTSYLLDNPHNSSNSDIPEPERAKLAAEIIYNENLLLQTLGFEVYVELPHKNVVLTGDAMELSKSIIESAWSIATNCLHFTTLCLQYDHKVLACVCLNLALKGCDIEAKDINGMKWWQNLVPEMKKEDLEAITSEYASVIQAYNSQFKKWIKKDEKGPANNSQQSGNSAQQSSNSQQSSRSNAVKHGRPSSPKYRPSSPKYRAPSPAPHQQRYQAVDSKDKLYAVKPER